MVSVIANSGSARFMIFENKMNGKVLIKFLRRLIKDQTSKLYLILDNSTIHHARIVKACEGKYSDKIKLWFGYAKG